MMFLTSGLMYYEIFTFITYEAKKVVALYFDQTPREPKCDWWVWWYIFYRLHIGIGRI